MVLYPNLSDVLKHHIAVPIESLDACKKLLVVTQVDEDLNIVLGGALQHRQWPHVKVVDLVGVDDARYGVCRGKSGTVVYGG